MISIFAFRNDQSSSKLNIILYYFILSYIVSLFLKGMPVFTNLLMGFIFLLAIVNFWGRNYLSALLAHRVNLGIILFFLILILSTLFSEDKKTGLDVLQRRLSLLILPVAFCFISFERKTWHQILLFFAFATTIASLAGFLHGFYLNVKLNDSGYLYNDNISALLEKQAVYFSFYVNCAILVFIYFLFEQYEFIKKHRTLILFSIIWLLFICFMLACKTAMVSIFIYLLWIAIYSFIRKRKFFEMILLSITIIVGVFLVIKIAPKTMNRFQGLTHTGFQFDNQNNENHFNATYDESKWGSTNTRIAIWQCAIEVWKDNLIFGTSIGDRNASLYNKYKEKNFRYAYETEKNTHNQYLDIAVSMGIVGLAIFLFVFLIYPLIIFVKQKQKLALSIFIFLGICFLTENMLDRYQGEILIALILPLAGKEKM